MSDPKDCLYCQNNETLHSLMIEIARLSVSRVFLFKEQTYRGRWLNSNKGTKRDMAISLIPFDRLDFRTLGWNTSPLRGKSVSSLEEVESNGPW